MAKQTKIIKPQEGFQEKFVRSNVDFVVGGGVLNCGKMNPLYTNVLTPNGWVKMGDLKVGDLVCTPFGKPSKILNIFEHKQKDIYRLTTLDGRQADCGLEHLWAVRSETQVGDYRKNKDIRRNLSVVETSEIIDRLNKGKEYYIPNPRAIEFEKKDFVIPPYVLGILIGDGCITESAWRSKERFMISNMEMDVIERTAKKAKAYKVTIVEGRGTNYIYTASAKDYYEYLHDVGLIVKSHERFIPQEYLFGSIEQRRELLAGLFDTDGTIDKKCSFVYSTTSEALKKDIIQLCRSLGYKASFIDRQDEKFTSGHEYLITVQTNDFICQSDKHKQRYEEFSEKQYKGGKFQRLNDHSRIKSVEYVGVYDARCIYIEDDMHLYIIDDYLTTHNTFAAVLSVGEAISDPNFRAVFLRNNLNDLKSGGGILDTFREVYGNGVTIVESGDPSATFPSGARCDITHVADQSRDKVMQRFKGRQYDYIYFDEGTGFTWDTFTAIYSRNRGRAKWSGKVRMTTNPERDHWLRIFLDWYIGVDGFIREDREGVVRYFYMAGETVKDVVWGDTKEECYQKCKADIDRKLAKINGKTGNATYRDMIKSFTFYLGRMSENKASLGNNSGYVGSVAISGGRNAEQLLEGNWNVSSKDSIETAIPNDMARQVFMNDPATNGDKWITCDLADVGTDNFTAIAWDGFHIYDMLVVGKTTPRQNAELLLNFAKKHDIGTSHIIYDGTRGLYINDYIPDAIPFISAKKPEGMYYLEARSLKEECYMRLAEAIKRGEFSIADEVANSKYEHQKVKEYITIQNEFLEECAVVYFIDAGSGKKRMPSKKEMNAKLGKERSMDVLDPCAMRMYPCLEYAYGDELIKTASWYRDDEEDEDEYDKFGFKRQSIFDETLWS